MLRKRNKKYIINKKAANDTLQSVFEACEQQPNTKPLEVIEAWTIVNSTVVKVGLWMSVVLLAMVLAMPLAFVNCKEADDGLRDANVEVVDHYLDEEDGCFVMVLDGVEIDYDGIYAVSNEGKTVFPESTEESTGEVRIPFASGTLNIYIPKSDGTYMQAVLSK